MRRDEYLKLFDEFQREMREVSSAKNADYSAGTEDAMHDYKAAAEECQISPMQAWFVLFMKHVRAVRRYVLTGMVSSESVHGRFVDIANYAILGDCLVKELSRPDRSEMDLPDDIDTHSSHLTPKDL